MGMHQMLGPISGSADPDPIDVTRSLRFTSGDSAYLSRTPSSAGNRRTWTWSGWIKRTTLGSEQALFNAWTDNSNRTIIRFNSSDQFQFLYQNSGTFYGVTTTQLFRDVGAWLHLVIAMDTTKSTSTDRVKVYVNGSQIADANLSSFGSGKYPPQNTEYQINSTTAHHIGARKESGSFTNTYLDAYLANIQFIDGEALQPSKFGTLNDDNVWVPVEYSGSYGTNGFYLQFNSTTTSALGDDTSGNNNDYTPQNLTGTDAKLFVDKKPDGNNWGNIANAFDGNTSTYADGTYNNGTTSTITFNPPLTGVTSLRFYWYGTSNYGYNGSNVGSGSTTAEYKSVYSGSAITVNSIQGTSQPGNGVVRLYAIEVNGSVLTGYSRGAPTVIDSVFDSPTNGSQTDTGAGGEVSGNYATMNPLGKTKSAYFVQDGNLKAGNSTVASGSSGNRGFVPSSIGFKTGKWYCECVTTRASDGDVDFAIGIFAASASGYYQSNGTTYNCRPDAKLCSPGGLVQSYGTSWADGDVIGIAVDMDSGTKTIQWFKNGSATGSAVTISTDHEFFFGYGSDGGGGGRTYTSEWNFGQRPFSYNAPSGFKALCTTNLSTPPIADGSTVFDAITYTGSSSPQTVSGLNFTSDFIWIKSRSHNAWHILQDSIRGFGKTLFSNSTNAEIGNANDLISNVSATGFSVNTNYNGGTDTATTTTSGSNTYVAWAWDAGSSTVTNNDGSNTSSVRANASAGFSIVTGSGNSGTYGHGLNAKPDLVIVKQRNGAVAWAVAHSAFGTMKDNIIYLNGTNANTNSSNFWGSTDFDSSVFPVSSNICTSGATFVAYCFTSVNQYSSFGTYTGNGSTDGPFVHTGFRVAWLLLKKTSSASDAAWMLHDSTREPFNDGNRQSLSPNNADAEQVTAHPTDLLSNGFRIKTAGSAYNASGETFIYIAFAEHPFKTARAR